MPMSQKMPSAPTASSIAAMTLKTERPIHWHRKSGSSMLAARRKLFTSINAKRPFAQRCTSGWQGGAHPADLKFCNPNYDPVHVKIGKRGPAIWPDEALGRISTDRKSRVHGFPLRGIPVH